MEKKVWRTRKFAEHCFEVCEREYTFVLPQEIVPKQMQAELNELISEFGIFNIDQYDMEATFGQKDKIGVGMAECREGENLAAATLSALDMALEGIGKELPEKLLLFLAGDLGIFEISEATESIQNRFKKLQDIIFGYNYRADVDGELPAKVIILVG